MGDEDFFSWFVYVFIVIICYVFLLLSRRYRSLQWLDFSDIFRTKTVTLVAENTLREPTFNIAVTLKCPRSSTLFYIMQQAVDLDPAFRFSVKYFGSALGFFVEGINGQYANYTLDETWWKILDGNMQPTNVGVSSYKPRDRETVTFRFTQDGGCE